MNLKRLFDRYLALGIVGLVSVSGYWIWKWMASIF